MKKIVIKVEKTGTGYSAYSEKHPAYTTGRTLTELTSNMVESLNLYFEAEANEKVVTARNLDFQLDLSNLFEVFPINVKAFSNRLGMNYSLLIQYIKGNKKPSAKQTEKILEGMQQIGKELTEINLV